VVEIIDRAKKRLKFHKRFCIVVMILYGIAAAFWFSEKNWGAFSALIGGLGWMWLWSMELEKKLQFIIDSEGTLKKLRELGRDNPRP
jgi:hypothetical protein